MFIIHVLETIDLTCIHAVVKGRRTCRDVSFNRRTSGFGACVASYLRILAGALVTSRHVLATYKERNGSKLIKFTVIIKSLNILVSH